MPHNIDLIECRAEHDRFHIRELEIPEHGISAVKYLIELTLRAVSDRRELCLNELVGERHYRLGLRHLKNLHLRVIIPLFEICQAGILVGRRKHDIKSRTAQQMKQLHFGGGDISVVYHHGDIVLSRHLSERGGASHEPRDQLYARIEQL